MEQTNNQEVKYNLPNAEEQKKKNRRITGIFVLLTTIVLDACSLFAYFATLKDKEKKETYVVSEESKSIHNNLLTYIKTICDDEGHPIPNQIVGINYQDNQLLISSKNETNEIYVTYDCGGGIETALRAFQNSVPSLEGYSIESTFTLTNEKQLNITTYVENNNYVGFISKSLTDLYYVSSTYLCTCGSLISIVHQLYDEGGTYLNKLSASKENKLVYDLLYVITFGVEQK